MRRFSFHTALVFTTALLVGFGGCKEQGPEEGPDRPEVITDKTVNKTKLFWIYWDSAPLTDALIETEAPRRDIILLNAWFHTYIPKFKEANPDIKAYVYKDLSSTRSYAARNGVDDEYLPTGVGYAYAMENHPEWFLTDDEGNHLEYSGYSNHWQMDVGNSEYQQLWSDRVVEELVRDGWDGVMLDNALFAADQYHTGLFPKQYKTNQSIQNAYKSMLGVIKAKLDASGKESLSNLSNARTHPGAWNAYLEYLSGGFDEWWLVFGKDDYLAEYAQGWSAQLAEVTHANSKDKITLVQPHSGLDDDQGFYYAFASYWLVNDGNTYFSEQKVLDAYKDPSPWRKEYEMNFGKAEGEYYEFAPNIYRRDFSRAVVLVNVGNSGSVNIDLKRSFIDKDGRKVQSVVMSAQSGVVLQKIVTEQ